MGDKDKMGFPCTLYYGKDLQSMQPLPNVVLDDVRLQSEEEKAKWDNLCCQTLTIETKVSVQQKCKLLKWNLPKLPRKLKKKVKKDYFVGDVRKISRWDLVYAYCLNNPHKANRFKCWNMEVVKK